MFVSDLRHFMNLPEDIPGPTRRMAWQLSSIVRAATAAPAGTPWETALRCQRRPGHRACPGHIAVFRADLPAAVDWRCTSCGDEGVIRGWEDSPADLRKARSNGPTGEQVDMLLTDDVAATLRDLILLDSDSERVVFRARASNGTVVITGTSEELDTLIDAVAAEANHEPNPRRQKRLDAAFDLLSEAPQIGRSDTGEVGSAGSLRPAESRPTTVIGRWRIVEMDLWDAAAIDLVGPAFIEFDADNRGRFGFIAVSGWLDCRHSAIEGRPGVEWSWVGSDDNDDASGRGWASLHDDGSLRGHIYFHMGDDSGFEAHR